MIGRSLQQGVGLAPGRPEGGDGALPWVANLSTLFSGYPAAERPARAADAGFTRIESWWPFSTPTPSARELEAFIRSVDDAGVQLVALNLYGGPPGTRGVLSHPELVEDFCASTTVASTIATSLGTRLFNAPFGDRRANLEEAEQLAIGIASLCEAIDALPPGSTVLIEPLSAQSPAPATPTIRTIRQALDVVAAIEKTGREDGSRVLLDVYHLTQNGEDLVRSIAEASDRIGHVQLADAPGRAEPGTGGIDFASVLDALHRAGYPGSIALEFFPTSADLERTVGQLIELLHDGANP